MTKAYVDTTVIVDATLKIGDLAKASKEKLSTYEKTLLPIYAIKEMKAGPLNNFIWMHNLLKAHSLALALEKLRKSSLSPRKYQTATAIEAISNSFKERKITLKDLTKTYGPEADVAEVFREETRLQIKAQVIKAWSNRRRVTTDVIQPLACYEEIDITVDQNGLLKSEPIKCTGLSCCAAISVSAYQSELDTLIGTIDPNSTKAEDIRNLKSLKEVKKTKPTEVSEKICRGLGDAFFAIMAPSDCVILTTNKKDHEKLAGALHKTVETPGY